MPEVLTPAEALKADSPLILTAILAPVAGQDRFQPAGFPEVGHVIYKAPRGLNGTENVCIVDSPASMANHLESVCMRSAHDLDLVDDLAGMPYIRCVTGTLEDGKLKERQVVVTSLTEGHRIASTYFHGFKRREKNPKTDKAEEVVKAGQTVDKSGVLSKNSFEDQLIDQFGVVLPGNNRAHPPPDRWWDVFKTIFKYDPNALVHGVLFPQWQIKISRMLTAHLEAFGAARVDRSGVKFDRLGKTTSGQPIFAIDDATAREIRASFTLDLRLLQSLGREGANGEVRGLSEKQKEFLVALALWKIERLLRQPFRYRSGCYLECKSLQRGVPNPENAEANAPDGEIAINPKISEAIRDAKFRDNPDEPLITDVYWPTNELYREPQNTRQTASADSTADEDQEEDIEDTGEDV
jgi:CRISPR-associated protein Csb1